MVGGTRHEGNPVHWLETELIARVVEEGKQLDQGAEDADGVDVAALGCNSIHLKISQKSI